MKSESELSYAINEEDEDLEIQQLRWHLVLEDVSNKNALDSSNLPRSRKTSGESFDKAQDRRRCPEGNRSSIVEIPGQALCLSLRQNLMRSKRCSMTRGSDKWRLWFKHVQILFGRQVTALFCPSPPCGGGAKRQSLTAPIFLKFDASSNNKHLLTCNFANMYKPVFVRSKTYKTFKFYSFNYFCSKLATFCYLFLLLLLRSHVSSLFGLLK